MLFSSSVFLFLFLPVVLLVYYLPLRRWRQGQNAVSYTHLDVYKRQVCVDCDEYDLE